jgi:cell division septal protein FtsQ
MANSTRKRSIKAKPSPRARPKRGRKTRAAGNAISIGKYVLPAILISFFLGALGFFALMGYRTVTASGFFEVRNVEVRGISRASQDEINKIVGSTVTKTGTWNADLDEIRARVEKVTFVKSATISRVLPNGIRVDVLERKPEAIVTLSSGDFLIDSDGEVITSAKGEQMPAVIRGWDESKTEKAAKDNLQRFKLYQKMVSQWSDFGLLQRVREVNLGDLQDPHALIEDSGSRISVSLAKDNLGKSLKSAIEAVAGKGEKVRSVNASGVYPVIEYAGF